MRRFALGLSALGLFACTGGGVYSPSDPAEFDGRVFDGDQLAQLAPGDRAYVQGHALGVYLYGKTLPTYVGVKGYEYEPGVSAPHARVHYAWPDVMVATSGGTDGIGVKYGEDDVSI